MQTFLPYDSFVESARVLDNKRLGKQRVETLQILKAIANPAYGWQHHPAVSMWRGYHNALVVYGLAMCGEWQRRGFKDTTEDAINGFLTGKQVRYPPWIGNAEFHASHRSNLLRKDPVHYGQFGWTEPDNLPYVWPVQKKGT